MIGNDRKIALLQESAVMAADLVSAQGDKYLPLFEACMTRLEAARSDQDRTKVLREKALALSRWHASIKAEGQSLRAIAIDAPARSPRHNQYDRVNVPSMISLNHPTHPLPASDP